MLSRAAAAGVALLLGASGARAEPTFGLSGAYTLDLMGDVRGGLRRGGGALHRLLLSAEVEQAGWTAYGAVQHVAGLNLSEARVGDAQVSDNIDAPAGAAVYEAWVARESADAAWRVQAGIIDLNSEFDVQEVGALFLNSSHGVGPDLSQSTSEGPSIFPRPAAAATLSWTPEPAWTLRLGLFDGRRLDGALLIGEVEHRVGPVALQAGAWAYTEQVVPLARPLDRPETNWGGYAQVEADLAPARGERPGLRGWIRLGRSASALNPVDAYLGGGLVATDVVTTGDSLGLAVAHARFSSAQRDLDGRGASETAVELTYAVSVMSGLVVQPNVQFVLDPSGDRGLQDAWVVGARFRAAFPR